MTRLEKKHSKITGSSERQKAASRKWRKEHPTYYIKYLKEYHKKWRMRKRRLGLCSRCGKNKRYRKFYSCRTCRKQSKNFPTPTIRKLRKVDRSTAILDLKVVKKCRICGGKKHNGRGWVIDHSHRTRRYRGILCNNCNFGLGQFKDSISILTKAISYLRATNVR